MFRVIGHQAAAGKVNFRPRGLLDGIDAVFVRNYKWYSVEISRVNQGNISGKGEKALGMHDLGTM